MEVQSSAARIAVGDETVSTVQTTEVLSSEHAPVVTDETLVKVFIKIRDKRSELKRAFELEDTKLKLQQEQITTAMKQRCAAAGHTGYKTDFGTVYITESIKVSCGDWSVFYDWVKQTPDGLEFLEQRVKSGMVKEYMDKNNGELPPGISIFKELEARVRMPTKKASTLPEAGDPE